MTKQIFYHRNFGRGSALGVATPSVLAVILLLVIIPVIVSNIRRFATQEKIR